MGCPLFHVDAFAERPFAGNPAAVCLLSSGRDDVWLQGVAAEMNLAETAFLLPIDGGWKLRWFTPKIEVDLCGHATLASAHVLWSQGLAKRDDEIRFSTRSGWLSARRLGEEIELDFPLEPQSPCETPAGLVEALGATPLHVGRNRFDVLAEFPDQTAVRELAPDFRRLSAVSMRGLIATAKSGDPRFDFVSRFFAPASGVDEDPVTGSAHCCLGPYWASKLGKNDLLGFQASARGGVVRVRVGERALLSGQAITVAAGRLEID